MKKFAVGVFAVGLAASGPSWAIDLMPADYTVLPAGTNLALLYGGYSNASKLDIDGAGDVPGSKLDVGLSIARYLHYNEIGGVPFAVQGYIPFGGFLEERMGGAKPHTNDGIGDLTVGVTAWPLSSSDPTGTTLGLTVFLTAPTGAFRAEPGAVNLGSGAWTVTPQIGLIQGVGNGFFWDVGFDVALRPDHTENGLEFSRDPSAQFQTYLRYQYSPTTSVSFGYSGLFGGKDKINGAYVGTKTRSDQLRVSASTFLSPTLQLTGMVGSDIKTEGGFKNDAVVTVRLMKFF